MMISKNYFFPVFAAALFFVVSAAQADLTTFTTTTSIAANDFTYDGDSIVVSGTTVTIAGLHSFAYLRVMNTGTLTHPVADTDGLKLVIATDVIVDLNSIINAHGKGFPMDTGPGAGFDGSDAGGGGYAGIGGDGTSSPHANFFPGGLGYGSAITPVDLGSGGGGGANNSGGNGGGRIDLDISNGLFVYGTIDANGNNGTTPNWSGGGGSGGSIFIRSVSIEGSGSITANGGNGGSWGGAGSGGGGGGRIALRYDVTSFTGTIQARGGAGWSPILSRYRGGAGSIFTGSYPGGFVVYDNGGNSGKESIWQDTFTGLYTFTSSGKADVWAYQPIHALTLSILDSSIISAVELVPLEIFATNISISTNSQIFALGKGHPGSTGDGAGQSTNDGGGGGYGGRGGRGFSGGNVNGGLCYGDFTNPTDLGSGGGNGQAVIGGAGGGSIQITASGTVTHNGLITANGANGTKPNYSSGGGSGGSINIECSTLQGSGTLEANGGTTLGYGNGGSGGGGGGRIAVKFEINSLSGNVTAYGTVGWNSGDSTRGGAGTVYLEDTNDNTSDLIYSNNNLYGARSDFDQLSHDVGSILIRGKSIVYPSTQIRADNFHLLENSIISVDELDTLKILADDSFIIDAGSSVDATGKGYGMGIGPGAGFGTSADAGGAGHGGVGGTGCQGDQLGGIEYDDECSPKEFGSGGGSGQSNGGGRGGGIIRFRADTLVLNGTIAANGSNGFHPNYSGGGGSGGSILVNALQISGSGTLVANGGDGSAWSSCGSGGGGGGRIALWALNNLFPLGNITVDGGLKGYVTAQDGEDGTVCFLETTDCDENDLPDQLEILDDPSLDSCPTNGILDICEPFSAPVAVAVSGTNTVLLKWKCVPHADSYDVYTHLPSAPGTLIGNTTDIFFDVSSYLAVDPARLFYVVAIQN